MSFLLMSIMFMSMMFFIMNHPMSKGLILLLQTILIALTSSLLNLNYWYSYILFLIMIGGMLILFIYMTSIASNEKFKPNLKMIFILLMFLMITMIMINLDQFYMNILNQTIENKLFNMNYNLNLSMMKYFNFPNYFIMISMIIYLFITLIAIVKITNFKYGPLRQHF
uniref:NADH dehydrogenase subunit 6 n=1 Tax=Ophraella communa TaxID=38162 RepID=UPI000EF2F9BA|nr:NADH dehydrogenase subunit 6 [Ophraella communa]AST14962.1 NADH dehydrogenase subunit 6 [Ophraella communa]